MKNFIILFSGGSSGQAIGIQLTDVSNVLVANNTITGFESVEAWNGGSYTGINVEGGASNIIVENNLMYNLFGIFFSETAYNQVVGNNIVGDESSSGLIALEFILRMLQTTIFTTTTSLTVPPRLKFLIRLMFGMMVTLMAETIGETTWPNIQTLTQRANREYTIYPTL